MRGLCGVDYAIVKNYEKDKEIKMCLQLPVSINSTDALKIDLIKTFLETQLMP
jgi:hypothetical protein